MLVRGKFGLLIVVLLLGVNMIVHFDVKKNIAYSTSIHLLLMIMMSMSSIYSVVVLYIMLHGIIKGQLFQSSGYEIHRVGCQDMRKFNIWGMTFIMLLAIVILSALVRIVIVGGKELVVLGALRIIMIMMVVISFMYTLMYANKLSISSKIGESEGYYVVVLIFMSINLIDINFDV